MKRSDALTTIRAEVAEHGHATRAAVRAYVENRVSIAAFYRACREGLAVYNRRRTDHALSDALRLPRLTEGAR